MSISRSMSMFQKSSFGCSKMIAETEVRKRLFMIFDTDKPFELVVTYKGFNSYITPVKVLRFSNEKDAHSFSNSLETQNTCLKCGESSNCIEDKY